MVMSPNAGIFTEISIKIKNYLWGICEKTHRNEANFTKKKKVGIMTTKSDDFMY